MAVTRLLIEMNRSLNSTTLFSEFSSGLSTTEKSQLVQDYYLPYRNAVEAAIAHNVRPVLHLSVHSFTPVLHGVERNVDVGLLFDPNVASETRFCTALKKSLEIRLPDLRIKFNEPYNGTDDGVTMAMRKKFPGTEYLGIEIELNQKFVGSPTWLRIQRAFGEAIRLS